MFLTFFVFFFFLQPNSSFHIITTSQQQRTVDDEACLVGVGRAKVVGDDTLVTALVCEGDFTQVQDSGVLHHSSACARHVSALVVSLHVGVVLRLGVP